MPGIPCIKRTLHIVIQNYTLIDTSVHCLFKVSIRHLVTTNFLIYVNLKSKEQRVKKVTSRSTFFYHYIGSVEFMNFHFRGDNGIVYHFLAHNDFSFMFSTGISLFILKPLSLGLCPCERVNTRIMTLPCLYLQLIFFYISIHVRLN